MAHRRWPGKAVKLVLGIGLVALGLILWRCFEPSSRGPVYQGKHLREWMDGHPREYVPAVRAIGTNAIPFLLAELQATDSALARLGESLLARVQMGPLWTPARMRHYHARLAFQILDTNALPALLEALFSHPMQIKEGDLSWAAGAALSWLSSPEAEELKQRRLGEALRQDSPALRANACLAFYAGNRPAAQQVTRLAELTHDADPRVRVAATRGLMTWHTNGTTVLPALIARLADPEPEVRQLALQALAARGSNAVSALPALRAAYATVPAQTNLATQRSFTQMRWEIRSAIRQIDPAGPPPPKSP
jgi:hypothetical protein